MTVKVPAEYTDYVRAGRCVESSLGCEFPSYMVLWPLDKLDEFNSDYEVPQYAPGFRCFGSNGAGELLAFDEQDAVVCLPAIGMEPKNAVLVAHSWNEFVRFIEDAV